MTSHLPALSLAPLILLASPSNAQSQAADDAARSARDAAKSDRHDEAIDGFAQAMALAPDRRREWLLELGDQMTWSQRLDEATAIYREAALLEKPGQQRAALMGLARALSWAGRHKASIAEYDRLLGLDPMDRDARLARAQVLSWAGRLAASVAAYDALLRDSPGDTDALRGRARVLSWRGRYRVAIKESEALAAMRASDGDAGVILAESLDWMGRPDRALAAARKAAAADPGNARLADLRENLESRNRPEARLDLRVFDQSDKLEISELAFDLRAPLAAMRGVAGVRYVRAAYEPGGRARDRITVDRPSLYAGYRFSDALQLNGAVGIDIIDPPGTANDRSRFTFETYATWGPSDILRFDAGVSRRTFDSEPTLRTGLTATQIGGSADIRPDERTLFSVRGSRTTYSDGNRRWWWQGEAGYRMLNRPNVIVGYRYTSFEFRTPGQPGYYNPDRFRSHELLVRGSGQIGPRLRWDLRLIGGYETERPGGSRPTINAGASLTRDIGKRLSLEAGYDFSSSRSFAVGGFERGIARLTLRARF